MDVAEQWEAKPSQFPSGTPNSKRAKISQSKVSQEGQLYGSEAAAKQEEAEIREELLTEESNSPDLNHSTLRQCPHAFILTVTTDEITFFTNMLST